MKSFASTRAWLLLLKVLLLVLVLLSTADAKSQVVIALVLSGEFEVPAVNSSAIGTATFIYSEGANSILWTLDILNNNRLNIWGAPGAHLHCGIPGETGDIIVSLVDRDIPPNNSTEIGVTGVIDDSSFANTAGVECGIRSIAQLWAAMSGGGGSSSSSSSSTTMNDTSSSSSSSSSIYINVHSSENPAGEIRGDIMGGIVEDAQYLAVTLTGDAQVPAVMNTTTTNVSAILTMAYSAFAETIVYSLEIQNPDQVAFLFDIVHIHCGGVGVNGDIVVNFLNGGVVDGVEMLPTPDSGPEITFISFIRADSVIAGVCDGVSDMPTLWMAMMDGVGLYVNLHSVLNPGGEVRGDIGVVVPSDSIPPPDMMNSTAMPSSAITKGSSIPSSSSSPSPSSSSSSTTEQPTASTPVTMMMPSSFVTSEAPAAAPGTTTDSLTSEASSTAAPGSYSSMMSTMTLVSISVATITGFFFLM